jgi:hypothetical protein
MKILLASPTGGHTETETTNWLIGIATSSPLYRLQLMSDTYCDRNHNAIAQFALESGCDATMFIDSDQDGPLDIISRLEAHNKAIVGCAYRMRGGDHRLMPGTGTGLVREDWIPSGAMLVRTAVFEKTPFPWFPNIYGKTHAEFQGSDISFCKKATGLGGFDVWCDHDVSREVGHYAKIRLVYGDEIYGR